MSDSDSDSVASSRSSTQDVSAVDRPDELVPEAALKEQAPIDIEGNDNSQSHKTSTTQQLTSETDKEKADVDADAGADEDSNVRANSVHDSDAESLHIVVDENPQSAEQPKIGMDVVIIHGLYGSFEDESQSGPGSGSTKWVQKFADSFDCPRRVIRFEYEPLKLFAGHRSREAIKQCALKLLRAITAMRERDVVRRLITFVAHDIGGIILKEALITASLGNNSWMSVFEMSRTLVFQGAPHRSFNHLDMEERLSRFLYASYESGIATVRPSISSIPDFAATVIEINGSFVEAKIPLRSKIISVHGQDMKSEINPVFDGFCATMGVPLEKRFLKNDTEPDHDDLVQYLQGLKKDIFMPVGADQLQHERKILALSSPIYPFQTVKTRNLVADSPVYKSWLAHRGPQILYLHGSDRVREVAEQVFYSLEDVAEKETKRTIVLYFSFDRWDIRNDSLRDMLSTFLAQIMCHFPGLEDLIKVTFARFRQERGWTEADLHYLFERFRFTELVDHVMFVINHFDECAKGSQELFLENFKYLSEASELPWKVVITSHKPGALSNDFAGSWAVTLDLADVNLEPINNSSFEQDMTRLLKLRPDLNLLRDKVDEELQAFQGFDPLTRRIVWEQARVRPDWPDKATTQDIFGPLDVLPGQGREDRNLEQVLQWVLESIQEQQALRRILTWVLYSVRPLSVWELASVIYLDSKHEYEDVFPNASALRDLTSKIHTWFAGIMSIEQNEVKILHPRLRNILMGNQPGGEKKFEDPKFLWEEIRESAHYEITKLCLDFLSRSSVKDLIDSTFQGATSEAYESPMAADRGNLCSYALQAWTHHFLKSPPADDLKDILSKHSSSERAHSWARGYWALSNPVTRSSTCLQTLFPIFAGLGKLDIVQAQGAEDVRRGLLEAASKGKSETVSSILRDPRDPSFSADSQLYLDILMASAACGDEDLMLHILDKLEYRSDFEKSKIPPSLIHRSAWLGLHRFVDRILELGCKPDVEAEWSSILPASPLSQAARNHQIETVRTLLSHGANVDYKHKDGRTAIHHVAAQGHAEIAKILVEEGKADVESKDYGQLTTLYFACLWGQHHVAQVLLDLGADPDMGIKADNGHRSWSPLAAAADDGFERCVKLLLDHKADPNLSGPTENGGALFYAAVKGHLGVCKLLLEKGAEPNDSTFQTPLLTQVLSDFQGTKNQEEIFDLLLSFRANPNHKNEDGDPLLHIAIDKCKTVFVQMLLDHGADVEGTDSEGHPPLFLAAFKQSKEIVDMLLAKNAKINVRSSEGLTALFAAVPSPTIFKKLLEKGAEITPLEAGVTCLMYAASENHRETIQLLLQYRANLEDKCEQGDEHTALSLAVCEADCETVTLLAEAKANLKHVTASDGKPVIHYAAEKSTLPAILGFSSRIDLNQRDKQGRTALHLSSTTLANLKLLVNAGADMNLQDTVEKDTPLSMAAVRGDLERVKFFVERDADLELGSPSDGTALIQACHKGHFDIVKYLVENGANTNASCNGANGGPLHSVCRQNRYEFEAAKQAAMIDYLLEHGANLSGKAGLFGYAINIASMIGTPRLLGQLINREASVHVQDDFGRSPMHFAALNGIENFSIVLAAAEDAGGDVNTRDATGRLPIHWAAQAGCIQVLQAIGNVALIEKMVNETDLDGWTPLCWAARGTTNGCPPDWASEKVNQIKVIEFLLRNGADRTVTGMVGSEVWTPLKIARFHGQSPKVLDLLKYGLEPPPNIKNGEEDGEERPEDKSRTGTLQRANCDICRIRIHGYRHHCTTRSDFDLCFKCVERAKELQALKDDSFERIGPEFKDGNDDDHEGDEDDEEDDEDDEDDEDEDDEEDEEDEED